MSPENSFFNKTYMSKCVNDINIEKTVAKGKCFGSHARQRDSLVFWGSTSQSTAIVSNFGCPQCRGRLKSLNTLYSSIVLVKNTPPSFVKIQKVEIFWGTFKKWKPLGRWRRYTEIQRTHQFLEASSRVLIVTFREDIPKHFPFRKFCC